MNLAEMTKKNENVVGKPSSTKRVYIIGNNYYLVFIISQTCQRL